MVSVGGKESREYEMKTVSENKTNTSPTLSFFPPQASLLVLLLRLLLLSGNLILTETRQLLMDDTTCDC